MYLVQENGGNRVFEYWNVLLGHKRRIPFPSLLTLFIVAALFFPEASAAINNPPIAQCNFDTISAGAYHTCGVQTDLILSCWGDDYYFQSDPPPGTFMQVSAGASHTCGVKANGTLACWGYQSYGRADPPTGTFKQVSAGGTHTCGVKTDGMVVCWGVGTENDDYDCGDYSFYCGQANPPGGTFTQVSAGLYHTCGVRTDGTVTCWGKLDDGRTDPPPGLFTQVSAGRTHSCGVKTDESVTCWGDNIYGQSVPPAGTFAQISAGDYHSCGLQTDGIVACWGWNYYHQADPPEGTYTGMSAGGTHTCGRKIDGTVVCWGENRSLQATPPDNLLLIDSSLVCTKGQEKRKGLIGLILLLDDDNNGFTYAELKGNIFQLTDKEYPTCVEEISFINNYQFIGPDGGTYNYTIDNGCITWGSLNDTGLCVQTRTSEKIIASFNTTGGTFEDRTDVWATDFSSLNNDVTALKDWFVTNGWWPGSAILADGRVTNQAATFDGKWWIDGNVLYIAYPEADGCVDYKAYELVNDRLMFATDAAHTNTYIIVKL